MVVVFSFYLVFCPRSPYFILLAFIKKPQLKSFFVPIINRCLSFLQMTFKSFFSGQSVAPTCKIKMEFTWVNMSLDTSLTFNPYIFLFGFPRHQKFGMGEKGPSQPQNTEKGHAHKHTHTHTHTHNLDFFCRLWAHSLLIIFEFDSHQVLQCLLLCYVLLVLLVL